MDDFLIFGMSEGCLSYEYTYPVADNPQNCKSLLRNILHMSCAHCQYCLDQCHTSAWRDIITLIHIYIRVISFKNPSITEFVYWMEIEIEGKLPYSSDTRICNTSAHLECEIRRHNIPV